MLQYRAPSDNNERDRWIVPLATLGKDVDDLVVISRQLNVEDLNWNMILTGSICRVDDFGALNRSLA